MSSTKANKPGSKAAAKAKSNGAARAANSKNNGASRVRLKPLRGDCTAELESMVRNELGLLGEDPEREGLLRTPHRVAESMLWLTRGYEMRVDEIVG